MTLIELFNEWLIINHKDEIKDRTYLRYESCINTYIKDKIGNENIENINARFIQTFINDLKHNSSKRTNRSLSSSSINTINTILKLAFNYAVDFELLTQNPSIRFKNVVKENCIIQ